MKSVFFLCFALIFAGCSSASQDSKASRSSLKSNRTISLNASFTERTARYLETLNAEMMNEWMHGMPENEVIKNDLQLVSDIAAVLNHVITDDPNNGSINALGFQPDFGQVQALSLKATELQNWMQSLYDHTVVARSVADPKPYLQLIAKDLIEASKICNLMAVTLKTWLAQSPNPPVVNPPVVNPPVVNPPVRTSCKDEANFQSTFEVFKQFATNYDGKNLTNEAATTYTLAWAERYPCSAASNFIADFKYLKNWAKAYNGLNMEMSSADSFAEQNIVKYCRNKPNLAGVFQNHYEFAHKYDGLNYDVAKSRSYALNKVMPEYFTCQNDFK
jgi:hypothetical protein